MSAMLVETLRICKATTKFQEFLKFAKILIGRIIKQTGLINHVKKTFLKLLNSHEECFIKFRKTNDYTLNKLL